MAAIYGKDKKWTKTEISYLFTNIISESNGFTQAVAEAEFQRACDAWSDPCGLTFKAATSYADADIVITWKFVDGGGDILGSSDYPDGKNSKVLMTFDITERWTNKGLKLTSISFFSVALHEIGHAIGLGHSTNPAAVMYPQNSNYNKLNIDDINGAEYLYKDKKDGLRIMNETDKHVSWYAFNFNDAVKWVPLEHGNLGPREIHFYDPVSNPSGKYFIRFAQRGGGTELAGGTVLKDSMISLFSVGSSGMQIQIS